PQFRHQTYEPVPIGYAIQDEEGADFSSSPVWSVDQIEWERLGGHTAGITTPDQVTLGEMPMGKGQVRVIGALLPMPTENYYHPFGLADYALTYTGYQVFNNALQAATARGCKRVLKLGSDYTKLLGTEGKDLLVGTSGADGICGGGANDRIKGLDENDVIVGGKGRDRLVGGSGNDGIYAGADNDRLLGGKGNDRLIGFRGDDRIGGSSGKDKMNGQGGTDICKGGSGRDKVRKCERGRR
ncbi:MAG: calcium-binding protein, partial [Actinomycetota bacterium]